MSEPEHSKQKVILISGLVILWLAGSLFGLWWFQQKSIRPFISQTDTPESRDIEAVSQGLSRVLQRSDINVRTPDKVTLIHLWNPDCLCNNVSARHTQGVLNAFDPTILKFIMLAPTHTSDEDLMEAQRLNPRAQIIRLMESDKLPLTASPGLAIFNPDGQLAYFGAYGFGALCSLSDDELFTNMISTMLAGKPYGPFMNVAGSGCFCEWPHPKVGDE